MRNRILSPWALGVALPMLGAFGTGCDGGASDEVGFRLRLVGSSTIAPLAQEIGVRFEAEHAGSRVDVETGGSSRGIRDARSGAADIGMSSRALREPERAGLVEIPLAFDGVAFVVHASNPVASLTDEQLRTIYLGGVGRWDAVGGEDAPVVVVSRAEGRSELDLMTAYLGIEPAEVRADVVDGETQQNLKTVIGNPNAITYTSVGAAERAIESGSPLKVLPLGGVAASAETVRSGAFPLARPLVLLRPDDDGDGTPDPNAAADAFVALTAGDSVNDLVVGLGYVPLTEPAPSP